METLHPITVHFPIALVLTATLISILAIVIKPKRNDLTVVLYWFMLIGSVSILIALLSGLYESGKVVHNNTIHEIMETHELLGYIISGAFILLTVWVLIRNKKINIKELYLLTALLIVTSGLLVYSSYLGGRMVYEEGAGVKPMEKIIEQMHGANKGHSHVEELIQDEHEEGEHSHNADGHTH